MEDALESRAISDGTGATTLMYGVFEKTSDTEMKQVIKKTVIDDVKGLIGDGYRMNIALLRGKTYQVVFWAQSPDCEDYSVSDDMKVTIDYTGINNDELRDAFFATQQVTVTSNSTVNVTLKRPFAQVNVGAYEYDYTYAKENKLNVTLSSSTITDVPSVINLFDDTVSQPVDVEYTLNNIPTGDNEKLHVDVNQDGEKEYYRYLSMCYILADTVGSTHTMSFKFKDVENDKLVGFSEGLENVPAKRNWRTNLVGQILTGPANFLVIIDPTYDGELNIQ
jgi:hypothetical protein